MSFFIYDSMPEDLAVAALNFESDRFKAMLLGPTYVPSQRSHSRRSDVAPYEVSGPGYEKGGQIAAVTLSKDASGVTLNISLGGVQWMKSTLNAKSVVYYKSRGGPAANDELISFIGFEKIVSTLNGKFEITESVIRLVNGLQDAAA